MRRPDRLRTTWLLVGLTLTIGCATVAITGRSQLNMISDQQLVLMADQNFSQFMRFVNSRNAALSSSESPRAAATIASVNRVSERIIDAAGLRGQYQWETIVVKAREANAFVMSNGKIVIFTGLLPVAKREAGLATIIGHEVAHVVARHQAERMSQALLAQMVLTVADVALDASNSKYQPMIGAALGLGAQYGVLLPFSREHESEADHIGLFYMAKAGYDPSEAIGLWQRMEAAGGSGPWELLSTHPSPATRRAQLREWLPEANLYYAETSRLLPGNLKEAQKARANLTPSSRLTPIAARPSLQPGFWYREGRPHTRNIKTHRLVRKESCPTGECLVFEVDNGDVVIYTADYGVVEIRARNGAWRRFSPPQDIRWPLQVGDDWSDSLTIEESSGKRLTAQVRYDVMAYEQVTVIGGSFMAFRIVVSSGPRLLRESWYSPETRTYVRTKDRSGVISELVDYQKSDEPAGELRAP